MQQEADFNKDKSGVFLKDKGHFLSKDEIYNRLLDVKPEDIQLNNELVEKQLNALHSYKFLGLVKPFFNKFNDFDSWLRDGMSLKILLITLFPFFGCVAVFMLLNSFISVFLVFIYLVFLMTSSNHFCPFNPFKKFDVDSNKVQKDMFEKIRFLSFFSVFLNNDFNKMTKQEKVAVLEKVMSVLDSKDGRDRKQKTLRIINTLLIDLNKKRASLNKFGYCDQKGFEKNVIEENKFSLIFKDLLNLSDNEVIDLEKSLSFNKGVAHGLVNVTLPAEKVNNFTNNFFLQTKKSTKFSLPFFMEFAFPMSMAISFVPTTISVLFLDKLEIPFLEVLLETGVFALPLLLIFFAFGLLVFKFLKKQLNKNLASASIENKNSFTTTDFVKSLVFFSIFAQSKNIKGRYHQEMINTMDDFIKTSLDVNKSFHHNFWQTMTKIFQYQENSNEVVKHPPSHQNILVVEKEVDKIIFKVKKDMFLDS